MRTIFIGSARMLFTSAAIALWLQNPGAADQTSSQRPPGKPVAVVVDYLAPPDSLGALVKSAALIVRGRPDSSRRMILGNTAGIEYRVTVLEAFKASSSQPGVNEIGVVELGGGQVNGLGVPTTGDPPVKLRPRGESVLFLSLWPAVNGYSILSGGAFPIEGTDVVIPDAVRKMKAFGGSDRLPQAEFAALLKKCLASLECS